MNKLENAFANLSVIIIDSYPVISGNSSIRFTPNNAINDTIDTGIIIFFRFTISANKQNIPIPIIAINVVIL